MELREAIYSRRAVREFTAEPVDRAALLRLIDAAIQAPSAVNAQPWSFSVVQDRTVLARISKESKAYLLRTPSKTVSSRRLTDMLRKAHLLRAPPTEVSSQRLTDMLRNPEFDIFYRAPALIVISSVTANEWAIENCSLAAENLMLAACAEGLGSCWIGFAQAWLNTKAGKASLGLPASYLAVAPLIVGQPKGPPAPVTRKAPEIHWVGG